MIIMQVYSKERKSLQFPVMCDGYVKIPFGDGSNTPAQGIGIWGHEGELTTEFIVTPYEVNNHTTPYSGSQKSLSQASKGVTYIPAADRDLLEMCLFYNTHMSVNLKSFQYGSTAPTTPAKYRIEFKLKIGGGTKTITTTEYVIAPQLKDESSLSPTDYFYTKHKAFAKKSSRTVSGVSNLTINLSGSSDEYTLGEKVYNSAGLLIGEIGTKGSNSITILNQITNSPSSSSYIYTELPKEPTYVEVPHHIAVTYQNSGLMSIFYNGKEVAKGQHQIGGNFSFHESDIYLGQEASASSYTARRRTQFMGEYHEISITKNARNQFRSMNSLIPQFKNTLLYMDFGEENLDD